MDDRERLDYGTEIKYRWRNGLGIIIEERCGIVCEFAAAYVSGRCSVVYAVKDKIGDIDIAAYVNENDIISYCVKKVVVWIP